MAVGRTPSHRARVERVTKSPVLRAAPTAKAAAASGAVAGSAVKVGTVRVGPVGTDRTWNGVVSGLLDQLVGDRHPAAAFEKLIDSLGGRKAAAELGLRKTQLLGHTYVVPVEMPPISTTRADNWEDPFQTFVYRLAPPLLQAIKARGIHQVDQLSTGLGLNTDEGTVTFNDFNVRAKPFT